MQLTPTFSLTPLVPISIKYDYSESVYGVLGHFATLDCHGVRFAHNPPRNLASQFESDKALLAGIPLESPPPTTLPPAWYEKSFAELVFKTNATTENQYLLIFHVSGSAAAAFYIDGNLVRDEPRGPSGVNRYIALLLDSPQPQSWTYTYMGLVGFAYEWLELKGVEGYIL